MNFQNEVFPSSSFQLLLLLLACREKMREIQQSNVEEMALRISELIDAINHLATFTTLTVHSHFEYTLTYLLICAPFCTSTSTPAVHSCPEVCTHAVPQF